MAVAIRRGRRAYYRTLSACQEVTPNAIVSEQVPSTGILNKGRDLTGVTDHSVITIRTLNRYRLHELLLTLGLTSTFASLRNVGPAQDRVTLDTAKGVSIL